MSGSLSKRSDLANDNSCLGLSLGLQGPPEPGQLLRPKGPPGSPQAPPLYGSTELQGRGGPPAPAGEEPANAKWVKDGQNQLRRAAERDQNRNELGPPPEELEVSARNARNASGGALPLLIDLRGTEEEEEEDEEEEEGDGDSTPVQSDPMTAESEQSGERAPREHGRSASLLFGVRSGTASDEDSSWATLSQGSPAGSSPDDADSFWTRNSFETDSDLPAGWMRVQDTSGTYYWHIPTGTTQWEPPLGLARGSAPGSPGNTPSEELPVSPGRGDPRGVGLPHGAHPELAPLSPQLAWTGFAPAERFGDGDFWKDPVAEEADDEPGAQDVEPPSPGLASPGMGTALAEEDKPGSKCFAVRSLGWVEMSEDELAPGRSSIAVNNCIRQLSLHQRGPPGTWGEGRAMLLLLESQMLKLVDPQDQALLHAQPVASIRVWGVGRDSGRWGGVGAGGIGVQRCWCGAGCCVTRCSVVGAGPTLPCAAVEFPAPKSEVVQKFPVCYLGCVPVAKPVG
ncbi:Amyloid-beta A4 precursor protein-binding family B member 1, partial [Spheniscus magellanicus]